MASGDTLLAVSPAHLEVAKSRCGIGQRNSVSVLLFDDTADQNAYFRLLMPRRYSGGGSTVNVHCSSRDVTVTPHDFVVQAALMSITHDANDLDSDSFAALNGSGADADATRSGRVREGEPQQLTLHQAGGQPHRVWGFVYRFAENGDRPCDCHSCGRADLW